MGRMKKKLKAKIKGSKGGSQSEDCMDPIVITSSDCAEGCDCAEKSKGDIKKKLKKGKKKNPGH